MTSEPAKALFIVFLRNFKAAFRIPAPGTIAFLAPRLDGPQLAIDSGFFH